MGRSVCGVGRDSSSCGGASGDGTMGVLLLLLPFVAERLPSRRALRVFSMSSMVSGSLGATLEGGRMVTSPGLSELSSTGTAKGPP